VHLYVVTSFAKKGVFGLFKLKKARLRHPEYILNQRKKTLLENIHFLTCGKSVEILEVGSSGIRFIQK
jgi:hypothetical protein